MKSRIIALIVLAAALSPLSAQEYDRALVVKVMRANGSLLGEIQSALGKNDLFAAAAGFWKFADGMESIRKFTPPKGSKADWDVVVGDFVSVSLKAVGACGEKDAQKAGKLFSELTALNKKGHVSFR